MRVLRNGMLMLLMLAMVGGTVLAAELALPKTEEERQKMSSREINILRRQMREREDTAEAAFRNAETAFLVGEFDKAIEEFLAVSREYEDTSFRMRSVLRIGDVYYRQKRYDRSISYYQRAIRVPSEIWWPEEVAEDYARADYMIGVCYFDQNSMNRAFAHFRRFVQRHPESRFVDRAYDFIGRGNMGMKRFGQAIEAFKMVGTANISRDARPTISPGEELYVRVLDADVGLATRNSVIPVRITTASGDEERLELRSLGLGSSVFLGTIRTRLGPPRLTKALDEAYPLDIRRRLDQWMQTSAEMTVEADGVARELQALRAPNELLGEPTEEQQATYNAARELYDKERARLEDRIRTLRAGATSLQNQAYRELDSSYAKIETILAEWEVEKDEEDELDEMAQKAAERDIKDDDDDQPAVSLSDTFTQEQIAETREDVRERETGERTFRFRKALLEYWHQQLLQEYKTLDVKGNDTITVEYFDEHGSEEDGVLRVDTLGVASDATILAVGMDITSPVRAVIRGDDVRIKVIDPDMSISDERDKLQIVVSAILKAPQAEKSLEEGAPEGEGEVVDDEMSIDVFAFKEDEELEKPELIPEGAPHFTLTLIETGPHTGEFVGSFSSLPPADAPEAVLGLTPEKLVRAAYRDVRTATFGGEWVVVTAVEIIPASDGSHEVIQMTQSQLDRRSELEKGIALGKLGRVYQDLGLRLEASRSFDEAIKVVKRVVDAEGGSALGEEATYQMWDLYFASGDAEAAAEACARLIAAFPNSPLAPDALLIMAKAEMARTVRPDWHRALHHLNRLVTQYTESSLAPEAQYMMADIRSQHGQFDVAAFEACANRFPDSNFAALSLLRLSEYYVENRDFMRARDYLERITLDFPDFDRLDRVTYMRGICAYRMGDIQLSYTLMHETIERYPGTAAARSAGRIVTLLADRLKQ